MRKFTVEQIIESSICVSLGYPEMQVEELRRHASIYPLIEIREDLVRNISHEDITKIIRKRGHVIYTLRNDKRFTKKQREQFYKDAIDNLAYAIDLDVSSDADIIPEVLKHRENSMSFVKVLLSYHSFVDVSFNVLSDVLSKMVSMNPDVMKIAVLATNTQTALNINKLYEMCEKRKLVAFCMGEVGKYTRVSCIGMGAPFTYACEEYVKTAPGQLSFSEMKTILTYLYGDEQFWKSI